MPFPASSLQTRNKASRSRPLSGINRGTTVKHHPGQDKNSDRAAGGLSLRTQGRLAALAAAPAAGGRRRPSSPALPRRRGHYWSPVLAVPRGRRDVLRVPADATLGVRIGPGSIGRASLILARRRALSVLMLLGAALVLPHRLGL